MQNKAEYKGVVEFEIQSIVLWFSLHNAFLILTIFYYRYY